LLDFSTVCFWPKLFLFPSRKDIKAAGNLRGGKNGKINTLGHMTSKEIF
jgi:hypothetical protein